MRFAAWRRRIAVSTLRKRRCVKSLLSGPRIKPSSPSRSAHWAAPLTSSRLPALGCVELSGGKSVNSKPLCHSTASPIVTPSETWGSSLKVRILLPITGSWSAGNNPGSCEAIASQAQRTSEPFMVTISGIAMCCGVADIKKHYHIGSALSILGGLDRIRTGDLLRDRET